MPVTPGDSVKTHTCNYMMKSHVVIAHYYEDLGWLREAAEAWPPESVSLFVYTKGPAEPPSVPARATLAMRPNVGREAETWLHHLCEHYSDLPDTVYFLQGNPFDHVRPIDRASLRAGVLPEAPPGKPTPIFADLITESCRAQGVHHTAYHELLFDAPVPTSFSFVPGAQYAVSREDILAKPKAYYERLSAMLRAYPDATNQNVYFPFSSDRIDPWSIERMWPGIFSASVRPRAL